MEVKNLSIGKIEQYDQLLYSIFEFLDRNLEQRLLLYQVCKSWKNKLDNPLFYKLLFLKFKNQTNINNDEINFISNLEYLQYLKFSNTTIPDAGVKYLSKLTHLKYLYLNICNSITNIGLSYLFHLTSLETLHIDSEQFTDEGLVYLSHLTNLKELNINFPITGSGLRYLFILENLESLSLNGENFMDENLEYLLKFPKLKNLKLQLYEGNTYALKEISNLRQLEHLELIHCFDKTPLDSLSNLTNLRRLTLYYCNNVNDSEQNWSRFLLQLKSLTELNVLCNATLGTLFNLEYLTNNIEKLTINGFQVNNLDYLKYLSLSISRIDSKIILDLSNCYQLQFLTLKSTYGNGSIFLNFDNMINLTHILLDNKIDITNLVVNFHRLVNLREVSLYGDQVTNEILNKMEVLNLEKLELSSCRYITDFDLCKLLDHNRKLTFLSLFNCELLTEKIFTIISKLTNLRSLELVVIKNLTKNFITFLTNLTQLRRLTYPNTTNIEVEEIKRIFPHIKKIDSWM